MNFRGWFERLTHRDTDEEHEQRLAAVATRLAERVRARQPDVYPGYNVNAMAAGCPCTSCRTARERLANDAVASVASNVLLDRGARFEITPAGHDALDDEAHRTINEAMLQNLWRRVRVLEQIARQLVEG